ncbi:Contactin-associated protein-like 5 [Bagarius yarrelli]|uniref:Contactin-associated protein-like 5 n=1 Tax=Bagarius yarrelli TaxID=175774 RepID=A0A556U3C0_BAGYA|nr:Contactin-associated protein-like 5 [Bagarius yarrelli]
MDLRAALIKLALTLCCIRLSSCKDGCDSPLVSNLPQSAFRSSSQLSNSHGPGYAKLNRRDGAGGWSPLDSINHHWLEINLGERTEVTAVATQGRYGSSDWVTRYLLMFSDTGHNWRQYRQEDSIGVFLGNTNADSVVSYKLQQPVFAQFLRVLPLRWNPNGRVGLRLEAYGCQYRQTRCRSVFAVVSSQRRRFSIDALNRSISRPFKRPEVPVKLLDKPVSGYIIDMFSNRKLRYNDDNREVGVATLTAALKREWPFSFTVRKESDVASFDGSSYLLYKLDGLPSPSPKDLLTMNFKTLHNSGVLMHMEGSHGHTLSLELLKGKLFMHLRKGNFHTAESLGSLLDDQHWHRISIERLGGHVNFSVDKSTQQLQLFDHQSHFEINEQFDIRLSFFHKISFGGVSADGTRRENSRGNFYGCLENVQYNGVNILHLAKNKLLPVVENITFTCLETVDVPVTFTSSESFLQLPWVPMRDTVSVGLQFRTWNKAGLLLTFDLHHQAGTLWVYLSEARARMQVHKAGRVIAELTAGSGLNDGQWHSVDLSVRRGRLILAVDKSDMSTVSISFPVVPVNRLFLGGCPITDDGCRNPFTVFQGCMRLIHLDEVLVDLIKVQQMLMGNFSDLQMDMCSIVDRTGIVSVVKERIMEPTHEEENQPMGSRREAEMKEKPRLHELHILKEYR